MLTFPSVIQPPSFPIDISYEDIALQSKKENGVTKIRKKFSNARVTFKLTWNAMSVYDYKILEDFYINDCETNVNEFVWKYPNVANPNEVIADSIFHGQLFTVRFDEFSAKANEYSYYNVSITLKGVSYVKSESKPVYGEIIPIVYGNTSTYLIDNTSIDGTLIWGEETSNSDTGYVNNYTSEKYFSDNKIVDADINKNTSEIYTAYVSNPNNQYIINAGSTANSFSVKRNDSSYKDINSDYIMQGIRTKVYPLHEKVQEKIGSLSGVTDPIFTPVMGAENSVWQNFKVDSNGYFDMTVLPLYDYSENYVFKNGPMYDLVENDQRYIKTEKQQGNRRDVLVKHKIDLGTNAYYNGNANGYYDIKIISTCSISDKYNTIFTTPYLNNEFNTIKPTFCVVDNHYWGNLTKVRYHIGWASMNIGRPDPDFYDKNLINKAIKRQTYDYPYATKITIPLNSTSHKWRGYSTKLDPLIPTENDHYVYTDPDAMVVVDFSKAEEPKTIQIGGSVGISDSYDYYETQVIVYSIKIETKYTKSIVDLNSVLQEGFQSNINFIDIPIQNGFFARFTCNNGQDISHTSYTFVGLYSSGGYFIIKPSINIDIKDNLSIIQLSNGSYLLGIYNKGLYWIKKDGSIQNMVSNNLYNFRLNYKRREV